METALAICTVGVKIGAKVAVNYLQAGAGTVVDFIEAGYEASQGNYGSAMCNAVFGVADLVTLGIAGAAKNVAKETGKQAAVDVVKNSVKASSNKIGREAAKQIAMGGQKNLIVGAAIISVKSTKKEIGKKLGTEFAKGMLEDVTEEAFKRNVLEATVQGAAMNVISNGGKNIASGMFEGAACSLFGELQSKSSSEIWKTTTATAAKHVVDEAAPKIIFESLKKEVALNVTKGTIKRKYDI